MSDNIDSRVSPSLHPDIVDAVEGCDEETASVLSGTKAAFAEAYRHFGQLHDAAQAAKEDPTLTEAAQLLQTADFGHKVIAVVAPKFDSARKNLESVVVGIEGNDPASNLIVLNKTRRIMSETVQPDWLNGWKPSPKREPASSRPPGNPAWAKDATGKGASGNPNGRPPNRPDKRLLATAAMLDEMRAIVSVLVGKALEGDTNAASIVLAKVLPSVKAQAEKVNFPLNTDAPISEQVAQVLDGIAAGAIAPDVGRLIIDSVKSLGEVRTMEQLEARIAALEQGKIG